MVGRTAFTVGLAVGYDSCLMDSVEPLYKSGARSDYGGGWVWATLEEAEAFLASATFAATGRDGAEFGVYQLLLPTGWEEDVFPTRGKDGVHRLANDALIVGRVR